MSKELDAFNRIMGTYGTTNSLKGTYDDFLIIRKALIKAREQEKVLKIIFAKRVDMWHLVDLLDQDYELYVAFCKSEGYDNEYILTDEEFDTLKRYTNER